MLQRALYIKRMATTLHNNRLGINLKNDNMPTINMMKAMGPTKRSKFIEKMHAYIRETIKGHNVKIRHEPSKRLKADMFTNALERLKPLKMRETIDVLEIPNVGKDILG